MIKGKDILNHSVVAVSTGEKIDRVHDVILDHQANQVLGLLVDEGGWFSAAKVVPFDRIRSVGEDAIMSGSPDDLTTWAASPTSSSTSTPATSRATRPPAACSPT